VLKVLTRNNRAKVIGAIQDLLGDDGVAYLGVARNIPVKGKLGINHCVQSYVVLDLPVVHEDDMVAIYRLEKWASVQDTTIDHLSRRDAGRDR
jgi:hypothetical protein